MKIFDVSCQFNDTYAFRDYPRLTENQRIHQELIPDMSGASHPGVRRCEVCGELLNKWDEPLQDLIIKKRRLDISSTYDGVTIVSKRFKDTYEAANLIGLDFRKLPSDAGFFSIRPTRSVAFDAELRKTRFIDPCPRCGQYESVVGATPVYLKPGTEIDSREFVRTDLEFASGDEKNPLILCGEVAANVLKSAKLKGLELIKVESDH